MGARWIVGRPIRRLFHLFQWNMVVVFLKKLFIHSFIHSFIYLFIYGCVGSCCTWAFSSCGEWGLLLVAVHGLLIVVASPVVEHGLQVRGLQ